MAAPRARTRAAPPASADRRQLRSPRDHCRGRRPAERPADHGRQSPAVRAGVRACRRSAVCRDGQFGLVGEPVGGLGGQCPVAVVQAGRRRRSPRARRLLGDLGLAAPAARTATGLRRRRSADAERGCRRPGAAHHVANPRHRRGARARQLRADDSDGRHGQRARPSADRGHVRVARIDVRRPVARQLRRLRHVLVLLLAPHHDGRGRDGGLSDARGRGSAAQPAIARLVPRPQQPPGSRAAVLRRGSALPVRPQRVQPSPARTAGRHRPLSARAAGRDERDAPPQS